MSSPRLSPKEAMQMAIDIGKRGAGFVSPNPLVGCVILSAEGKLISAGHHAKLGEAHAEVHALEQIGNQKDLMGAQVYVTLEPCAHEGRTPSCAKKLAKLPIASVTYGLEDPNPLVSGKGLAILRSAGIRVEQFQDLEAELAELCEIFLCNVNKKRPFVALKVATTLDAKMASVEGKSQWITGEASRGHVQYLRGCYDAVLIGAGTWKLDDPRLNSRDIRFVNRANRVVLMDPLGETIAKLSDSNLMRVRPSEELFLVTGTGVKCSLPIRQIELSLNSSGQFDLKELMANLFEQQIFSLFVEGGAQVYGSFFNAGLVDRIFNFISPQILGPGLEWTRDIEPRNLSSSQRLKNSRIESFDEDFLVTGLV